MKDWYWLNDESVKYLSRGYLAPGQTPKQRVEQIGNRAEKILNIPGFANRFVSYMAKGWISLASPVWTNFGNDRGLPISCNNSHFSDSTQSILYKCSEIGMMTKLGAGTSGYLGDLRPRGAPISSGGASYGAVHFMELIESMTQVISQGSVRRGSCAVTLPIEHGDIEEFLTARETGSPIQKLSLGITVTDDWMKEMIAGDRDKRELWAKVIRKRFETGYPYIMFKDTVNRTAPQVYRDKGMIINSSNLCQEIVLPSSPDESFVCDLSSLNLLHYDEWKDTDLVETMTMFLDAVLTEYIEKLDRMETVEEISFMKHARNFAVRHRALGLGTLGWHSYLMSRMIPFGSAEAYRINAEIYDLMNRKSLDASKQMALRYGEPDVLKGYGERNTTRLALAPTTSSSFILGQVSQSIEPVDSNYYVKDLQKTTWTYRNPYLEKALDDIGLNTSLVWHSILLNGGSVQHLGIDQDIKDVFKTFIEIDQEDIILQASDRQRFIDQSQSLNLTFHPNESRARVNKLYITAWKTGIKTLYYQFSKNVVQEIARNAVASCTVCEA